MDDGVGPPDRQSARRDPLWKRALPILVMVAVVAIVFGAVLPNFIDYDAVFRAIGNVSLLAWVVLAVAALVRVVPEGLVFDAAQPGIGLGRGTQLFLVSNAMAMVPPGGLDIVTRFAMCRSWGFDGSSSSSATVGSWLFANGPKLLLPAGALVIVGAQDFRDGTITGLAWLGVGVAALVAVLLFLALRSEGTARALGRALGALARRGASVLRRESTGDWVALTEQFRMEASETLTSRFWRGIGSGLLAQLAQFVVLLLAVRAVGLDSGEVPFEQVFAAFSVVAIVSVIPLVNVPGVSEAIYIAVLTRAAGQGNVDEVSAAVFIFRALTWLMPLPLGGMAFNKWRSGVDAEKLLAEAEAASAS